MEVKKLEFDVTDPANMGRPWYFIPEDYAQSVVQTAKSDEINFAREMLKNVPGWYRKPGNYPSEFRQIKRDLAKNQYSLFDYSDDRDERSYTLELVRDQIKSNYMFPRLDVIDEFLSNENSNGKMPWLFEISPSHGNLPIALMDKKRQFTFFGRNMNHLATKRFREWLKPDIWNEKPHNNQQRWLVCYEVLEHASLMSDVVLEADKQDQDWDKIFLSVPNGTLGHGLPSLQRRLGHIRTFNAKEFVTWADNEWPGYSWRVVESISIVLVGER